jgi:hypothetical protein
VGSIHFEGTGERPTMGDDEIRALEFAPLRRLALRWNALNSQGALSTLSSEKRRRVFAAHPFAAQTREVKLVHATEKPLISPEFVRFKHAETPDAKLVELDFDICLHLPSTLRIDVLAKWTDYVDDVVASPIPLAQGTGRDNPGLRAVHGAQPIEPFIDVAPQSASRTWKPLEILPVARTHDFLVGKHREVTYSMRAISRHAEFFEPQTNASAPPSPRFTCAGANEWRVRIRNSSLPPHLTVEPPVPVFEWHRTRDRGVYRAFRRGGLLRVHMSRPWNCSGNDEMLGVIVANGLDARTSGIPQRLSAWGQDPIRESLGVGPILTLGSFQGWTAHLPDGKLLRHADDRPGTDGQLTLDPYEPEPVTVVGYVPRFPDQTCCYADVELDPGSSYFPFVSLSIARFQAHSLPGRHLSQATRLDMIQVPPHRWVHVWRERNETVVRMYGYTHGRLARPLQQIGTTMVASVEQHVSGTDALMCWIPARDETGALLSRSAQSRPWASLQPRPELTPGFRPSDFFSYWEARVPMPAHESATQYRLVIEERESYLTEVRKGDLGDPPVRWRDTEVAATDRVVFLDIVDL